MMRLARGTATERATFPLEMDRRRSNVRLIELPMSRRDIPDCLGLTSRIANSVGPQRMGGERGVAPYNL